MDTISGRYDIVIVGAGLSGLMAAQRLAHAGLSVIVVEREPVAGGRLATWRSGSDRADTGAQFFTVRTTEFGAVVERWLAAGWIFEWSRGWSDGSLLDARSDGYPRYVATDGFATLAERLSIDLSIRLATEVLAVSADSDGWYVMTADGEQLYGYSLILTSTVPRSLAMLDAGGVEIPETRRQALDSIQYGACLCGIFVVDGDVALPEPGALQRPDHPISWVADNRRKGISFTGRILTVHSNLVVGAERWVESDESVLAWMAAELESWLAPSSSLRPVTLKRWPYAVPLSVYPARYLALQTPAPLIFAGDAFDGPRVEGAALSGLAAVDALLKALNDYG